MAQPRLELSDPRSATVFYDDRYAQGYMEEWSEEKKRRIAEVVSALRLPTRGRALDFGCGNGVLTDVLRRALPPGWEVVGTDLSAVALENARSLHPGCTFAEAHFSRGRRWAVRSRLHAPRPRARAPRARGRGA
jgi:trans-aconitate methyltransferase